MRLQVFTKYSLPLGRACGNRNN